MSFYEKNITQTNVNRSMMQDPDSIEPCPKVPVTNGPTANHKSLTPTISVVEAVKPQAVEVRGLTFTHGSGKKAVHALRGIDLTVPEGQM